MVNCKVSIICDMESGSERLIIVVTPSSISIIGYFVWIINRFWSNVFPEVSGIDSVISMCDILNVHFVIGNCGFISFNIAVNVSSTSIL